MSRVIVSFLTTVVCFVAPLVTVAQVATPSPPALNAAGYLLIDHNSGRILASKNPGERLDPASITKLMTAYVVFRSIKNRQITLQDQATISEKAWRTGGSRMFIEVNTKVSIEDLLQGMIVQSGNDASVALAEHVAGSVEMFSELMNQYAFELGMTNTHYMNSTGLTDENHYTSATDIAILASAIIREFPEYYNWYSQKMFAYNGIEQKNRNALLWRDASVDGMKTGYTENAGYCLVSSAKREDMRLISVVLGTKSSRARANDSQTLLNYGFRFFETRLVYPAGDTVAETRVWKGTTDSTGLSVREDLYVTIPRGSYDLLEAKLDLMAEITAPINPESQLGTLTVNLADETLAKAQLFALSTVGRGTLWQRSKDSVLLWLE